MMNLRYLPKRHLFSGPYMFPLQKIIYVVHTGSYLTSRLTQYIIPNNHQSNSYRMAYIYISMDSTHPMFIMFIPLNSPILSHHFPCKLSAKNIRPIPFIPGLMSSSFKGASTGDHCIISIG